MQYSILEKKYQSHNLKKTPKLPENSFRINLLAGVARIVGTKETPLLQLLLFSKIKNYIRFITLRKAYSDLENVERMTNESMNQNIFNSFMDLGIQLDIFSHEYNVHTLKKEYLLDKTNQLKLINFESGNYPKQVRTLFNDYKFIEKAITAHPNSKLGEIMRKRDFVYIKEVLTYVQEINNMNFFQQVSPSFSEDFYTDLGELAFNLYTKDNYKKYILGKSFKSILDIGCGNGNYIDIHLDSDEKSIVGVERQTKVYEKLKQKYKDKANIIIHNEDIKDLTFDRKFDMINMSYMLFYLTANEQLSLFNKLKEILHETGSIIVCQYYPGFEIYQEILARHNKKWDLISRYKYDICNSILQAEVVLNNMLIDFAKAEEWKPFLKLLDLSGFEVDEITPADDTYYSYFITIKHTSGGSND